MFLSIITRTYKRPRMLAKQMDSLDAQTDRDFEQIVIRDTVGFGVPMVNKMLRSVETPGDYVWIFDDDNIITDADFIKTLKEVVANESPDVIVMDCLVRDTVLPITWPPSHALVDVHCYVASQEMWNGCRYFWGARYDGDWDYGKALLESAKKVSRVRKVMVKTQKISKGAPE
jgi:hypothetical protein